ncbi:MAG: pyruvate ferredoxin oxidoreductase, partial [Deltaproteobacteria bacterium]|nr:pyruvate ferredoxin oxidoreductase [Deltaproteobacteria bacterium]
LTRVLGEAGLREGVPVLSAETHGMAMRGGSVVCQVKLGDFASPLILPGRADLLLGLDAEEAGRNRHFLNAEGVAVVNTPSPARRGEVDALALARASGSPQNLNMVLLGFATGLGALGLADDSVRGAVAALSPEKHRAANLAAFDEGKRAGGEA